MADTPFTPDDGVALAKAVDAGQVKINDLSPEGQLAYSVVKGKVDPTKLNDEGKAIYQALTAPPPDSMDNHPILNVAEKTAQLGGLVAGGALGASAGAVTSPVTGPVGPVVGSMTGAGLGYGAVKSGSDALNQALGYAPKKPLGDMAVEAAKGVGEGAAMDLAGQGINGVAVQGIKALQKMGPAVMDFFSAMSKRAASKVLADPALLETSKGTPEAIQGAVEDVQQTLKDFKAKASEMYNQAKIDAGIMKPMGATAKADESALKFAQGDAKAPTQKQLGEDYINFKTAVAKGEDPNKVLKMAEELKQDLNQGVKHYTSNVQVEPISKDTVPHLMNMKAEVVNVMKQLPGGQKLLDASENWRQMHDVYDSLQGVLKDTGKSIETVKKVFTDDSAYYQSVRDAFQAVDQVTGKNVGQKLENEVISHAANKALPDNIMGKRQIVMAAAMMSPGRMVTAPALMAAQSPALMTKMALAAKAGLGAVSQMGPALVGGAVQGGPALMQAANAPQNDTTERLFGVKGQ